MTEQEIKEIEARCDAATEMQVKQRIGAIIHNYGEVNGADKIWGLFISPARTDNPDLIKAIRDRDEKIKDYEKTITSLTAVVLEYSKRS